MPVLAPQFTVSPATTHTERHTIHAYFTGSPESPDGSSVLYYTSATREGHEGDLRIQDRLTGKETIIAEGIITEDAHRVACQQWTSGGRRVIFQHLDAGTWVVGVHDLATGETNIAARDRQLGWSHANSNLVPLAGLHWDAESCRDMEFLDLETGKIRPGVTAEAVRTRYPEWVERVFGQRPISVCAGILSPDSKRLFFKVAAPETGEFQSAAASVREGLIGYDLESNRFLFLLEKWGHPSWMPDSRHILNVRGVIIDSEDGSLRTLPRWPVMSGSHPSSAPDARQYVSDCGWHHVDDPHIWNIMVGSLADGRGKIVHQFKHEGGAQSWRPSHPHPVFSPDSQRIYFNSLDGPFTQLHVLERTERPA